MSRLASVLAIAFAVSFVAAGCVGPCTSFPTWATLDFSWTLGSDALVADLADAGWTFEPRRPAQLPRASLDTEAGPVWMTVEVFNQTARLQFRGPTMGTTTEASAREELAPAVKPLATRYDAVATYHAGTQECGDV